MHRILTKVRPALALAALGISLATAAPAQALTPIAVTISITGITGTCTQYNGFNLPTSCAIPVSLNYTQFFDKDLTPGSFNLANPGLPYNDPTGLGGRFPAITGMLSSVGPGIYSGTNFTWNGVTGSVACTTCQEYHLSAATFSATTPVPEPATWAMMLAGFGLLGAAMRRQPAQPRIRAMLNT